jgi:hypothetical protein
MADAKAKLSTLTHGVPDMTMNPAPAARRFRLLGKAVLGVLLLGCVTTSACPQGSRPGLNYDVKPRRVDLVPAGTVIDAGPPKNWSHLIIKSQPRAAAGDYKQIAPNSVRMAGLLFTGILANVKAEGTADKPRHRLAGLAVGMGTKIDGKDTIITPDTQRKLGANLGFLAGVVLTKAYEKLEALQLVARSDTMAVLDAPNILLRDGKHQSVVLRYAFMVDAATGKLDTLLWAIERDAKGNYRDAVGPIEWLPPSKIEDCVLHVDAREFSALGVPNDFAFALNQMVKGDKTVELPDALKPLAGKPRLTTETAADLETKLRDAMKQAK